MFLPLEVAQPEELIKRLNSLAPYPPGVVNLRYTVDNDWSGDPAIFFLITLSDEAARPANLAETSRRIMDFVTQQIDPVGQWGLIPYFNFRSQSEIEAEGRSLRLINGVPRRSDEARHLSVRAGSARRTETSDLRRAASAAYYALFHLLTTEAAPNWKHPGHWNRFARIYDHGRMKTCSSKVLSRPIPVDPSEIPTVTDLKLVADVFVKLQQARHTADYDNSKAWSRTQVWEVIAQAEDANEGVLQYSGDGSRSGLSARSDGDQITSISTRYVHSRLAPLSFHSLSHIKLQFPAAAVAGHAPQLEHSSFGHDSFE